MKFFARRTAIFRARKYPASKNLPFVDLKQEFSEILIRTNVRFIELKICFEEILAYSCLKNNWQTAQRFSMKSLCENHRHHEKAVHRLTEDIGHFALFMVHFFENFVLCYLTPVQIAQNFRLTNPCFSFKITDKEKWVFSK